MVLTLATAVDRLVGGAKGCAGSLPLEGLYVRCFFYHSLQRKFFSGNCTASVTISTFMSL